MHCTNTHCTIMHCTIVLSLQVCNYTVPTDIPEIDNTVPTANLELEWVHGYSR
jgi:hypothetical protein